MRHYCLRRVVRSARAEVIIFSCDFSLFFSMLPPPPHSPPQKNPSKTGIGKECEEESIAVPSLCIFSPNVLELYIIILYTSCAQPPEPCSCPHSLFIPWPAFCQAQVSLSEGLTGGEENSIRCKIKKEGEGGTITSRSVNIAAGQGRPLCPFLRFRLLFGQ